MKKILESVIDLLEIYYHFKKWIFSTETCVNVLNRGSIAVFSCKLSSDLINKFVFHTRELKYKIFFTNSKLRVHYTLHFSRMCRTHKNFQLFIKLLLKISFCANFFVFFGSLKTRAFFYHPWSSHFIMTNRTLFMHFLKKWRSNIYLKKQLLRKRNFQKSFKLFFS